MSLETKGEHKRPQQAQRGNKTHNNNNIKIQFSQEGKASCGGAYLLPLLPVPALQTAKLVSYALSQTAFPIGIAAAAWAGL